MSRSTRISPPRGLLILLGLGAWMVVASCTPHPPANPAHPTAVTVGATPGAAASARGGRAPGGSPPSIELPALAELRTVAKLAPYVADPRPEARRLVAVALARSTEPEATPLLGELARDAELPVAAAAIAALSARPGTAGLVAAGLEADDEERFAALVTLLRDEYGAVALLSLLAFRDPSEERDWYHQQAVFDAVAALADPRGADALVAVLGTHPHPHFAYRAAVALAELGDVRAAGPLAHRLLQDPLTLYRDDRDWELVLKRDDQERVVAARLVAEVAMLHPERRDELRAETEDALISWLHELPSPHSNGLRALAELHTTKALPALRAWAHPQVPLPQPGEQPPMPEEWIVAQSALRYVGRMQDAPSFQVLLDALAARPRAVDVTMNSLLQGGLAILGMSLRALGFGAADGLSEWGDPRGFEPLLRYIDDVKNNEQSREEACLAVAWVADRKSGARLVRQVLAYDQDRPEDAFRRACLLQGMAARGLPSDPTLLLAFLDPKSPLEHRHVAALALARAGLTPALERTLQGRAGCGDGGDQATLALSLGGSVDALTQAVAKRQGHCAGIADEGQQLWASAFAFVSAEDLDRGFLSRALRNADALGALEFDGAAQTWAKAALRTALRGLEFDHGPHSLTRVRLRYRLLELARGPDAERRRDAVRALGAMNERGSLLALLEAGGPDQALVQSSLEDLSPLGAP